MSRSVIIVDRFADPAPLRTVFDERFAEPRSTRADRFAWDYWHVPGQYTHLRTPAWTYFPRRVYAAFHQRLVAWGRETLGVTINEFYGQTECNMVVSSCAALDPARPGRMGRAVPGHAVEIVDAEGRVQPAGVVGEIAVRRGDPVMFLGYWNNPQATQAKFVGEWLMTGDIGAKDEHGWLKFEGRGDDIITSAGYRIGPGEIEDCLITHPAVQMAGRDWQARCRAHRDRQGLCRSQAQYRGH